MTDNVPPPTAAENLKQALAAKKARPAGSTTAISCCGANPGMVSFFVKQALLDMEAAGQEKLQQAAGRVRSRCGLFACRRWISRA